MNIPTNLKYTQSHEWVQYSSPTTAKIGLTDYAQSELGDLVFVNLPDVGDNVSSGERFGDVESVKAVSDILSPVTGTITAVNEALLDAPETINSEPYGAWLIEVSSISASEDVLDAAAYETLCKEEG